jgi:hypothetical protein
MPCCGNGLIEPEKGETCDINSSEENNGCEPGFYCMSDCLCNQKCGNGEVDEGVEECDLTDMTVSNHGCESGYTCNTACVCDAGTNLICGNGQMDEGEECDPSASNDPGCPFGMSCVDCQCFGCGDGIIDTEAGEMCEPGLIDDRCAADEQCTSGCLCEKTGELPGGDICVNYTMDFDTFSNGTAIPPGLYVEDDWWGEWGITLEVAGGADNRPRVFDTANPGPDPDLGAPNESCPGGGPGIGLGGTVGTIGENCEPLGNVLIIQEQNEDTSIPDDEARGGNITINFAEPIVEVYELGMMDIERRHPPTFVYVTHEVDGVQQVESFPVIGTGNNGVQSIPIYRFNVTKMTVAFGTSGAIDWITWCF